MTASRGPDSGALRLEVSGDDVIDASTAAEIISLALFDLDAQAVGHEGDGTGPVLVAGFPTVRHAQAALEAITAGHGAFVHDAVVHGVDSADWVASQRDGLEPTVVGPWHIRAPWHPQPTHIDPLADIVIDPGVAFGHGAHPTTQLTIELMHRQLTRTSPDRVVDLGTGTGVAALIAARSGLRVLAVEHDAGACQVARLNIERNSTPADSPMEQIELVQGDAADVDVAACDLVVANVTLDVQRLIAPACASADRIVVSGLLCNQVRAMQDLYPGHRASTICTSGEWAGIEFSSLAPRCRKNCNE